MPHHEVYIVLVTHLRHFHLGRNLVVHHQVVVDVGLHVAREVVLWEVVVELGLHIGVLRGLGSVGSGHVVTHLGTVSHVGDVPDGIGARGVLQGTTRKGIGVFLGMCGVAIQARRSPVATSPHSGVDAVLHIVVVIFLLILCLQRVIGDGIDEAGAIDADGGLETHHHIAVGDVVAAHLQRDIVGFLGNINLRIREVIRLAVGELVTPFVGIAQPVDLDLGLVDGRLEGCDSLGLRHARQGAEVSVVAVGDDEQVAIAPVVGTVTVHLHAMAVARVASDA